MTLLTTISNESVNENLEKRWKNGDIYTWIGSVLISVNPFKGSLSIIFIGLNHISALDLGIYTDAVLQSYKGKNRLEVNPHVYSIAESAYYNMNAYHENQCVIISGESGAGKTEAAKRIMQYIAAVSGGRDSSIQEIKDMVLATNPLLESFGCAKTLRNNNSSRHVRKYLRGLTCSERCVGQIPRDHVQRPWRADRCSDHELPPGEGTCGRTSRERAKLPHLLPVYQGCVSRAAR